MVVNRRMLEELYVQGKKIDVSPDPENPVYVYVRKLGPAQHQTAVRKANAARVKTKSLIDSDDEERILLLGEVASSSLEEKVHYLAEFELGQAREKIEQEISESDEWKDEDGDDIQAIVDAWDEDMQIDYSKGEGKRSEESEALFNKMKAFNDLVEERLGVAREKARDEIGLKGEDYINREFDKSILDREAGLQWLKTYREYQILYGIEDPETKEKIYSSVDEVKDTPVELWSKYIEAIDEMNLTAVELKS
jgi:hypothetical protein